MSAIIFLLFLCVANQDKLLPGWSHFAQFTMAVVNKDPKKSKYSDTVHRFWMKEHDWGWKKFMVLSKVLDGFIDADTLIIKAQVQVIRNSYAAENGLMFFFFPKSSHLASLRPRHKHSLYLAFFPLFCPEQQIQSRLCSFIQKEILTLPFYTRHDLKPHFFSAPEPEGLCKFEQICRRFVEERRSKLGKLIEDKARWSSFCAFWVGIDQNARRGMSREKTDAILGVVVKNFFIEKEVTSTLVMDSLYSGLKALEGQTKSKKGRGKLQDAEELPVPIVCIEKDIFVLVDDLLPLLERAAFEPLPPKDDEGPQNRTKDGGSGEDFNKDSIERDERRLTEIGRGPLKYLS
ncbi:hypothetical protein LOK49_LG06G02766 [Camellia lanceoleosa]|uniref:Uncharacterized protein n=1 Tax=Camellia lanceoleosa TaxID=1840588 RepID=A0ACC0HI39_9ERIC|nr:hypothetical protein LOK49_LG06G02766 [Camellia lanceoleosa]